MMRLFLVGGEQDILIIQSKTTLRWLLTPTLLLIVSQVHAAASFNISFAGEQPDDTFGAFLGQPGYWNQFGIPNPAGQTLTGLDGIETMAMLFAENFQAVGSTAASTNYQKLLNGAMNQLSTTDPWTLTITGIPNGNYSVALYASSNTTNPTGDFFVQEFPYESLTHTVNADDDTAEGIFTEVTNGTLHIRRDPTSVIHPLARYAVAGLQIKAVPEPGSMVILGLGALLVTRRRRRD